MKNLPSPAQLVKMGYLGDNQTNKPASIKKALKTYTDAIQNSPAAQRKAANYGDSEVSTTLGQKALMTPEEMVKNEYVLVPTGGDGTSTGTTVSKLAGLPLEKPVQVWGGGRFGEKFQDLAYASMLKRAQGKQDQFTRASQQTGGRTPMGVHMLMGDTSYNFATPTTELMVGGAKAAGVPKKVWKEIDAKILAKKKADGELAFPHFVGFSNNIDDAMSQLLGINGFSKDQAGPLRKAFLPIVNTAAYRDKGFPILNDIIDAVAEPELRNAPISTSGFSIFEGVPNAPLVPHDVNLSYDSGIVGRNRGGVDSKGVNIPAQTMFLDPYKEVSTRKNKHGEALTDQQRRDSLWMDPKLYQVANQQWLDHVSGYIDTQKKLAAMGLLGASGIAGAEESTPTIASPPEENQSFKQFMGGLTETGGNLIRGAVNETLGSPNAIGQLGGGLYNMVAGNEDGLLNRFGAGAATTKKAMEDIPILGKDADAWDQLLMKLNQKIPSAPRLNQSLTEEDAKRMREIGGLFSFL